MTLIEQIQELHEKTEKFIQENPGCTNVWWQILDADLDEMRALQTENLKMSYSEYHKCMTIQAHHSILQTHAVIFVHSKPVKVMQHIVVEHVYENV